MQVAILSGSVFGTADMVADEAASVCTSAGLEVVRVKPATVDAMLAAQPESLLVCTSTTGMGELPDSFMPFYLELQSRFPLLTKIPFGVIALGDSAYGDTFCQGGELMRELLLELQAEEVLPMLRLDASESVTPEVDAQPWLEQWVNTLAQQA
ncbi:MAG: flavodoxin domain-containing protein [Pseudomonas sp.]|uniref:flavodoxin domain-containing protein n=1 Tax=Halopseudomonas laoshanensis TaxID=2268758 RepID=UPI001B763289|nr:flavodoxin domain-containing protein [Pseudomonas sp.]MBQ0776786.1 flavodoxin domain-containing protein [Pseudomonas sp.]WOD10704.1 flavodoxin domain-containing protein [Pseudomonas sp. NyZ704]